MRSNLDPFGEHDDAALWRALEEAHLKPAVTSLSGALDAIVEDNGANFSVGQRQLLCLARVLLKRPKVLVLDEATSSVDEQTDQLIQATIRTAFRDCTILTIAHRLGTIADGDKVLVLGDGRKLEYGTPTELELDEGSEFAAMMRSHRAHGQGSIGVAGGNKSDDREWLRGGGGGSGSNGSPQQTETSSGAFQNESFEEQRRRRRSSFGPMALFRPPKIT